MFIKDEYKCKICKTAIRYYWILPDCKVGRVPTDNYICAQQDYYNKHYHISFQCEKCKNMYTVLYDKYGIRVD